MDFIKNMFGDSIRKQVMRAVEKRIKQAQREHDLERAVAIKNYLSSVRVLKRGLRENKKELMEKHVNNLISKIISND